MLIMHHHANASQSVIIHLTLHQICINESSQEIILVDDCGCLHVWSCSQEKIIKTETVCPGPLVATMLGTTPNDILAVGTNAVHLFHTYRGSLQRAYSGHVDSVISIISHPDPDESKLFTASLDNRHDAHSDDAQCLCLTHGRSIIVWNLEDMAVHSSFKESKSEISCMSYVGGEFNL
jgi:hypothetical protein